MPDQIGRSIEALDGQRRYAWALAFRAKEALARAYQASQGLQQYRKAVRRGEVPWVPEIEAAYLAMVQFEVENHDVFTLSEERALADAAPSPSNGPGGSWIPLEGYGDDGHVYGCPPSARATCYCSARLIELIRRSYR